jgi:hypothetical protein
MHPKEILARITGISIPMFGIQWQPQPAEIATARDLLRYLEDRRVLYRPFEMENSQHCVSSVLDMRQALTQSLKDLSPQSQLYKRIQKIRRACRDFSDIVGAKKFDDAPLPVQNSILFRELERLRKTAGLAIAEVAIGFNLDVEDDLAAAIPFNNHP